MARGSNKVQFLLSEIHRLIAILEIIYKHTVLYCISLYCPLQILRVFFCFFFSQIEGLWEPRVKPFPNHGGLLCVSLSHVGGNTFIITVFTMLICYQWSPMLLLLLFWGSRNHAQVRWQTQLINVVCVLTAPQTNWPFPHLSPAPSPSGSLFPETQY